MTFWNPVEKFESFTHEIDNRWMTGPGLSKNMVPDISGLKTVPQNDVSSLFRASERLLYHPSRLLILFEVVVFLPLFLLDWSGCHATEPVYHLVLGAKMWWRSIFLEMNPMT